MYRESFFFWPRFYPACFKKYGRLMVTGNEIVCFAKIRKPPRQHFGFFDVISSQVLESSKFKIIS